MLPVNKQHETFHTLEWCEEGLKLLDQRLLPHKKEYCLLHSINDVAIAIRQMVVRGAPAIGVAAAYGVVLGYRKEGPSVDLEFLRSARPTAVNLKWAIDQMEPVVRCANSETDVLDAAKKIHNEDLVANHDMAEQGVELLDKPCNVLTHCNAGALATSGYGTALGVIRLGFAEGKIKHVFADETRPWLQGARLTAWELLEDNIPVTLIVEGAAAWLMKQGRIDWVIVGADRIAANGDVANKIGTYSLALLARAHGVKFMVAAPSSTVDLNSPTGNDIEIETRPEEEILDFDQNRVAAENARAWNPVFDVTPAELITALVTEKTVIKYPDLPQQKLG